MSLIESEELSFQPNTIYCGDCKEVMRHFPENSVDLIYLDPPFFSNRKYEIIWKDGYEKRAFEDRWKGGIENYLGWMRERLLECHRVLKDTGTLWLHCDWHAVHYLKAKVLDDIFQERNFRNEVIWNHQILGAAHGLAFPKAHEHLLRYTKSDQFTFNEKDPSVRVPYSDYILNDLKQDDEGKWYYTRRRMTRKIREGEETHGLRTYVDDPSKGKLIGDVWSDNKGYQPEEKLGYPTQKPEWLLDRIVRTCSNPADIVLDPMCGCGTAIAASHKAGRRWAGIDVSPTACKLMAKRMRGIRAKVSEIGLPKTIEDLRKLQPFEFQNWVMEKLYARINPRLSGDMGIDGYYMDGTPIQVKQSDHVGRPTVDSFETAIKRANRTKGMIVAFGFSKDAYEGVASAKSNRGLEITLKPVEEILKET